MTKTEILLGTLVLGTCVGIGMLSAGVLQNLSGSEREKREVTAEEPSSQAEDSALRQRLALLEAQVNGMKRIGRDGSVDPTTGEGKPDAPEAPLETPEEQSERIQAEVQSHRDLFEHETVDPEWSRGAEVSLKASLDEVLAESPGVEVRDLECKTTICKGKVSWQSGKNAFDEGAKIAEHPYETNCGTAVYFTESAPGTEQAVTAEVVFDCTDLRAEML